MERALKPRLTLIPAAILLLSWSSWAISQALSADNEVEYFIKAFSDKGQRVPNNVYGELEFSGITDIRLFDIVEQRFIDESKTANSFGDRDHVAWLSKALAYSGQPKYLDSLNRVLATTSNFKLRKFITDSIERSPQFAAWNVDINRDTAGLQGDALFRKRTLNMLRSSDMSLVSRGARRVSLHHPTDKEYLSIASERLKENYNKPNPSANDLDGIGWLCTVLGTSKTVEYEALLKQIIAETKNDRIEGYAKRSFRELHRSRSDW